MRFTGYEDTVQAVVSALNLPRLSGYWKPVAGGRVGSGGKKHPFDCECAICEPPMEQ